MFSFSVSVLYSILRTYVNILIHISFDCIFKLIIPFTYNIVILCEIHNVDSDIRSQDGGTARRPHDVQDDPGGRPVQMRGGDPVYHRHDLRQR